MISRIQLIWRETLLDQSFSAENFRKIFDLENRKGNFLEGKYFPELKEITFEIKQSVSDIRALRRSKNNFSKSEYLAKQKALHQKKTDLKEKKEERLTKLLEKVAEEVNQKNFTFGITEQDVGLNKPVYREEQKPSTFFVLKQLQYNFRKLYKVKQGNRHNIVCQIRDVLPSKFPKFYIKTDIKSFYESIPRKKLLERLESDSLLTQTSKKFIRKILYEFEQVSGSTDGLPRGIGISAYLAELYMRDVDKEISNNQGVKFYVRYVDDIFILGFLSPDEDSSLIKNRIDHVLTSYGLTPNPLKTTYEDVSSTLTSPIEYLGYKFSMTAGVLSLSLTTSKIDRYCSRIDASFDAYDKDLASNPTRANKLLLQRIRFLTSNTRLSNNKKNVITGVYFSNNLITTTESLTAIDTHLSGKVNLVAHARLKARLSKLSAVDGFTQRRFFKFSSKELSEIVRVWKHVS